MYIQCIVGGFCHFICYRLHMYTHVLTCMLFISHGNVIGCHMLHSPHENAFPPICFFLIE